MRELVIITPGTSLISATCYNQWLARGVWNWYEVVGNIIKNALEPYYYQLSIIFCNDYSQREREKEKKRDLLEDISTHLQVDK